MGIRTDHKNPRLHHLDYRPDGYRGKRVREIYEGTREAVKACGFIWKRLATGYATN